LLPSRLSAQHLTDEIPRLGPHPCHCRSRPWPPGCGAPLLQQVAARPALLSRQQPAGQKGRRQGHRRRSSLGDAPCNRWQCKLTEDPSASQKATSPDTVYAPEKPVYVVHLTLPGCLDLTCSTSGRRAVFDRWERPG